MVWRGCVMERESERREAQCDGQRSYRHFSRVDCATFVRFSARAGCACGCLEALLAFKILSGPRLIPQSPLPHFDPPHCPLHPRSTSSHEQRPAQERDACRDPVGMACIGRDK
jgi:hypothetical protein